METLRGEGRAAELQSRLEERMRARMTLEQIIDETDQLSQELHRRGE